MNRMYMLRFSTVMAALPVSSEDGCLPAPVPRVPDSLSCSFTGLLCFFLVFSRSISYSLSLNQTFYLSVKIKRATRLKTRTIKTNTRDAPQAASITPA
jgi:hypothetical protein